MPFSGNDATTRDIKARSDRQIGSLGQPAKGEARVFAPQSIVVSGINRCIHGGIAICAA
jgi:hypothetical protein